MNLTLEIDNYKFHVKDIQHDWGMNTFWQKDWWIDSYSVYKIEDDGVELQGKEADDVLEDYSTHIDKEVKRRYKEWLDDEYRCAVEYACYQRTEEN